MKFLPLEESQPTVSFFESIKGAIKFSSIGVCDLSSAKGPIFLEGAVVAKTCLTIFVNALPILPIIFKIPPISVLLSNELSLAFNFTQMETSLVGFMSIPLIDAPSLLNALHKFAIIEGHCAVYLSCFPMRKIIQPLAFQE